MLCLGPLAFDVGAYRVRGREDVVDGVAVSRTAPADHVSLDALAASVEADLAARPGFRGSAAPSAPVAVRTIGDALWIAAFRKAPVASPVLRVEGHALRDGARWRYGLDAPEDGVEAAMEDIAALDAALEPGASLETTGAEAFCVDGGVIRAPFRGYAERSVARLEGAGGVGLVIRVEANGPQIDGDLAERLEAVRDAARQAGAPLSVTARGPVTVAGLQGEQATLLGADGESLSVFIAPGAAETRADPRLEIELAAQPGADQEAVRHDWDRLLAAARPAFPPLR
ncbi:hypothetical protein [Rubrimonas cliftonensis]|uniref:Uncharacterized protein n=1 Tax=Rubrimonas cliftonensis TaxID=89524 RepID=A0A1H4AVL9_9RHOB|nr:hypothetical protein [Rubrimonas cliftonensis]SEA39682.1 hypothetical protein SAMN05444370_104381 [Rubrimonas cliftonensis]